MLKDSSCYYVWGNYEKNATAFEVLTGTGFQWMNSPSTVTTYHENSYPAGFDRGKHEYVGRCNIKVDTFVGKHYDGNIFHYGYNGKEMNDCSKPDILLCDKGASG